MFPVVIKNNTHKIHIFPWALS